MDVQSFCSAEACEPEDGWRRVSLAGGEEFSFEWFEKPAGHSSSMHGHENAQVCVCLEGKLTVTTKSESVTLGRYDSAYLEPWEDHRVSNETDELAIGLDVFAPGRSFDFWTDGEE